MAGGGEQTKRRSPQAVALRWSQDGGERPPRRPVRAEGNPPPSPSCGEPHHVYCHQQLCPAHCCTTRVCYTSVSPLCFTVNPTYITHLCASPVATAACLWSHADAAPNPAACWRTAGTQSYITQRITLMVAQADSLGNIYSPALQAQPERSEGNRH